MSLLYTRGTASGIPTKRRMPSSLVARGKGWRRAGWGLRAVPRGAAETVAGALRRGARGASTGRCTPSSRRSRAQLDPLERGAGGVAAPRGAHNPPPPAPSRTNWTRLVPASRTNRTRLITPPRVSSLAQVYVQGRPFFSSSLGGAGGGAGAAAAAPGGGGGAAGGGAAARPARFPRVYHRAPRFEGLEAPPPPSPRTKWTRRVPHPVLIGHASSLRGCACCAGCSRPRASCRASARRSGRPRRAARRRTRGGGPALTARRGCLSRATRSPPPPPLPPVQSGHVSSIPPY